MEGTRYNILIIDDSPSDRKIYRRFLSTQTRYQFEVLEAGNVEAGLEVCRNLELDCIILDYHLPDVDGLTALSDIQKISPAPVIFLTGRPEALVITEAFRRGAAKYLSKDTVTSQTLQEAVYDTLGLSY